MMDPVLHLHLGVLRDLQAQAHGMRVLELGCGQGELTQAYFAAGFDAYGSDIIDQWTQSNELAIPKERFRQIPLDPYRLPFDDGEFDLIVSNQVLEHVQDYSTVFAEMHRVLKPSGISLHVFPSRYRPIEPHIFVPLATLWQHKWYLQFWAHLGIRNEFQNGLTATQVATANHGFLCRNTNYLPAQKILMHARAAGFNQSFFVPKQYYAHKQSKLGRFARSYLPRPFWPLLSSLTQRCLYCSSGGETLLDPR